jgi:hypothetical protein
MCVMSFYSSFFWIKPPHFVFSQGYKGMVYGKKYFQLANWSTVSGIVGYGGTIIGSARCEEFLHREGRLAAAKNLVKFGINSLVCIGGDGTLTGLFFNYCSTMQNSLDFFVRIKERTCFEMNGTRSSKS